MKINLTGLSIFWLLAFGCSSSNATPPDSAVDAADAPAETRADAVSAKAPMQETRPTM